MTSSRRHVFLITVDSFRYDYLNATFEQSVTPFFESVSADSLVFANAFATGSGTSTSFPGILASSLPLDDGYDGLSSDHVSLAEVLSENDVRTIGATASTVTSSVYGYDRGFDIFREPAYKKPGAKQRLFDLFRGIPVVHQLGKATLETKYALSDAISGRDDTGIRPPYTRADDLTDIAIDAVTTDLREYPDANRFVWLHYMDPHRPYFPPDDILENYYDGQRSREELNARIKKWEGDRPPVDSTTADQYFSAETMEAIRRFYRAEVRFVDEEIGRLSAALNDAGVLDESLFVVCADHGDEFYDHGDYGHRPKMYNELIHVPLIAYDPGHQFLNKTGTTDSLCSLLDIPPGVTSLFDVAPPPQRWRGQPLLSSDTVPERDYVISELCHTDGLGGDIQLSNAVFAVQDRDWKYIENRRQGTEQLFRIETDPNEADDVSNQHPQVTSRFQGIITKRIRSVAGDKVADRNISDDVYGRLEELGYY